MNINEVFFISSFQLANATLATVHMFVDAFVQMHIS